MLRSSSSMACALYEFKKSAQDDLRSAYTMMLVGSRVSSECQLEGLLENDQWGWRAHKEQSAYAGSRRGNYTQPP